MFEYWARNKRKQKFSSRGRVTIEVILDDIAQKIFDVDSLELTIVI